MKQPRNLKKHTMLSLVLVVTVIALIKLDIVSALLLFYIVGLLPGTDYVVPPNVMSLFFSAGICFVLFWPFILMVLRMILATRLDDSQQVSVKRFIKRRAI